MEQIMLVNAKSHGSFFIFSIQISIECFSSSYTERKNKLSVTVWEWEG